MVCNYSIRDRTETPTIFIHNGKSGGGGVRARFAAGALNYTRGPLHWKFSVLDQHYYPIRAASSTATAITASSTEIRKGTFCDSKYPHYTAVPDLYRNPEQHNGNKQTKKALKKKDDPSFLVPLMTTNYEGNRNCNATTPLGMILACPHPYQKAGKSLNCPQCDDDYYLNIEYYFNGTQPRHPLPSLQAVQTNRFEAERPAQHTCDIVYTSHSNFGSELNWLPPRYLKEYWWDHSRYSTTNTKNHNHPALAVVLERYWSALLNDRTRRKAQLRDVIETRMRMVSPSKHHNATTILKTARNFDEIIDDDPVKQQQRWCPHGYIPVLQPSNKQQQNQQQQKQQQRKKKYDRPTSMADYKGAYEACSKPSSAKIDELFNHHYYDDHDDQKNQQNNRSMNTSINSISNKKNKSNQKKKKKSYNYSEVYASLPVHRITMLRDPWSWVVSKFFWHKLNKVVPSSTSSLSSSSLVASAAAFNNKLSCELVNYPIVAHDAMVTIKKSKKDSKGKLHHRIINPSHIHPPVDPLNTKRQLGWCEQFSLLYLIKLCGNDCLVRYENGLITLDEIEDQVESNLRHGFSVVGLLNETETFYDMITDRIQYINMTYNPEIVGDDHATAKSEENKQCKTLFTTDEQFRTRVRTMVPAFAALERIYHVGITVNRYQQAELQRCQIRKGQLPTKGTYGTPKSFHKAAKKKAAIKEMDDDV